MVTPLTIDLPKSGLPAQRLLLGLDDVVLPHGSPRPLTFEVRGPVRIAISGPNGTGKTTLLRLVAGDLAPAAGEIRRLTERVAVLDQHVSVLDAGQSVLDNLRRLNPGVTEHEARATLARFAFRNTAALQEIGRAHV